jgi:hypothetical protein
VVLFSQIQADWKQQILLVQEQFNSQADQTQDLSHKKSNRFLVE